jgi:hypothetical protein
MGSRFDPGDRHNDDLVEAVNHAARLVSRTLAAGFHLLVASQGDNVPAIEAAAKKLNDLTATLTKSLPPT